MHGILLSSGLGAIAVSALAMFGPPADQADDSQPTTLQLTIARSADNAAPPNGHWEATLDQIGTLEIIVNGQARRVLLNKQPLPADRVLWQPDNYVMVIDPSHQRQFQVALGEDGRIASIRPGSWLEYRGANAPRVAIGIYTDPLTAPLASQLGLDSDTALLVTGVVEDMPAFKSGVRQFDVITAVDDKSRVTQAVLKQVVASKDPGQTIQLRLVRHAQPVELSINVEEVQPLSQKDFDPLLTGPFKDLVIDTNSFASPDESLQFVRGGKGIIQFQGEQAIVFGSEIPSGISSGARPNQWFNISTQTSRIGDTHDLETRIDALTQRIASLEALLRRHYSDEIVPESDNAQP